MVLGVVDVETCVPPSNFVSLSLCSSFYLPPLLFCYGCAVHTPCACPACRRDGIHAVQARTALVPCEASFRGERKETNGVFRMSIN